MIERFFGVYIPTSIFVIIVVFILLEKTRNYIAKNYSENSFLYRHFVTRLFPRIASIIFGIVTAELLWYFGVAGWIRFSFWIVLLLIIMLSVDKRNTEWPWEISC